MTMIKIEYIVTKEVRHGSGWRISDYWYSKEDVLVKPDKLFNDIDEAWDYAMKHGCNPYKNFRITNV